MWLPERLHKEQENAAQENRKTIFNQHDKLLSENQPWEKQSENFKKFYLENKMFFEKIQTLVDTFENENLHIYTIINKLASEYSFKNRTAARKEGFFANIKFHLKHADELNENRRRSMAIAVQTPLGIGLIVLGGIMLIPTIGTSLLYLPIAIIAIGIILTVTALVLAYIDQHEAIKKHQSLEKSISDLNAEKENHTSCLFETWEKIEAINFSNPGKC